jgi:Na+/proline symporter
MNLFDWIIVGFTCVLSLMVGLIYTRKVTQRGGEGFFTANRSLPWWAVGISNSATYQSGLGAFVMLIFLYGLAGNWLWWAQWIVWMPLVAIIWARMWRRMQIVTTAELISLRYGGRPAVVARKIYAAAMFCFAVVIIAYITGFFAKTIAPLVPLSEVWILVIFGSITALYTMFGGLMGSVMVAVVQMGLMIAGSMVFLLIVIPQFGGWEHILDQVSTVREGALSLHSVSHKTTPMTLLVFFILGLFFAGSPTAGEGMTAQRFMAAKNERHAIGGQLFNAFIALSLRIIPLVGLGILCMSLFWHPDLVNVYGEAPEDFTVIKDPAYAWGELIKASKLPAGFVGLLVATEVAAFMSTLSALINWGSSFIVNDIYKSIRPRTERREEVRAGRLTSLFLFLFAAAIAAIFVENMVSWFLFINTAVVIFWLPLAYFRFFWSRFNVWGELAATVLGLPVSILVWFVLKFDEREEVWQGMGLLFVIALAVLVLVTLLTPPESVQTLKRFFDRCRPPAGWKRFRAAASPAEAADPSLGRMIFDSALGMLACFGLVMATNAVFVGNILIGTMGLLAAAGCGAWLLSRLSAK